MNINYCSYPGCKNQAFDQINNRWICGRHKFELDFTEELKPGFSLYAIYFVIAEFFRKLFKK